MTTAPTWFDLSRHGDEQGDDQPTGLQYENYVTPTGFDRARLVRDLAATMPTAETEDADPGDIDYRTADRATVDAEIARINRR